MGMFAWPGLAQRLFEAAPILQMLAQESAAKCKMAACMASL